MTIEGLEPGALLEVLANIDQGTKRWRRKAKVIGIVGRWGDAHELGRRELAERSGISPNLLGDLLVELIEQRILTPIFVGQGSRGTVWLVNPDITQWAGVPWDQPVAAVRLWAFHVEHHEYAEPGQRRVSGSPSRRRTSRRVEGGGDKTRRVERRREGGSHARRGEIPASRIRAALARQSDESATGGVPTGPGGSESSPPTSGAGGASMPDSVEWRQVVAAVKAAARAPFLEGEPKLELLELFRAVGSEQILEWIPEAPADHKAPRLVAWLVDQQHRPPAEFLAKLEAREAQRLADEASVIASGDLGATTGGMGDAPNQAPRLQEFTPPVAEERADPAAVAAALKAARSRSTPTEAVDDRMSTTTGGTP